MKFLTAAKAYAALAGAVLTSVAGIVGGDSQVGKIVAVALAVVTAVATYVIPNAEVLVTQADTVGDTPPVAAVPSNDTKPTV